MDLKIETGDLIKAYDFKPCKDRPDMYVVGVVEWTGMREPEGYAAYQIRCVFDSFDKESPNKTATSRVGKVVYVPVLTSSDYDGRVTKV
jgi:hypothetical protein